MTENNPLVALLLHVKNFPSCEICRFDIDRTTTIPSRCYVARHAYPILCPKDRWYRELVGKTQALQQQLEGQIEFLKAHLEETNIGENDDWNRGYRCALNFQILELKELLGGEPKEKEP